MFSDNRIGSLIRERRSGKDRRLGIERRKQPSGFEGKERRFGPDRRKAERRRIAHGVLMRTPRSISYIENWLEKNCHGKWRIILVDIDEDLATKEIRIMFELQEDKNLFSTYFKR